MATFTWSFSTVFAGEFKNFPVDQQDKILEFVQTYETNGLADFSLFEGKLTPSWKTLHEADPKYQYAHSNKLWHYHVGIPQYNDIHDKYKTSDWVLHFQWTDDGITLVDCYKHYSSDGEFYLPPERYLPK